MNEFSYINAAILRRSILVALIVGPTLLWINPGPAVVFGPNVDYYRVALTFCVPFIVSLVSGTAARIEASIGNDRRAADSKPVAVPSTRPAP